MKPQISAMLDQLEADLDQAPIPDRAQIMGELRAWVGEDWGDQRVIHAWKHAFLVLTLHGHQLKRQTLLEVGKRVRSADHWIATWMGRCEGEVVRGYYPCMPGRPDEEPRGGSNGS